MSITAEENVKKWPGTLDGSCPECGYLGTAWDQEFHVADIGRFGVQPVQERLISLTCPSCKTKFKVDKI